MSKSVATSVRTMARIAGILYLVTIGSAFAEYVRGSLVVRGDPLATANNILASEPLYRLGFTADLLSAASYVGVAVLLYELLVPVSRTVSLLAAAFALTGSAIMAGNLLNLMTPVLLLRDAASLAASGPEALRAAAQTSFGLYSLGYAVATVFFGIYCVLLGYLIWRSDFLPRWLGLLLATGGIGYLLNSFANFLEPSLAAALSRSRLCQLESPRLRLSSGSSLWA